MLGMGAVAGILAAGLMRRVVEQIAHTSFPRHSALLQHVLQLRALVDAAQDCALLLLDTEGRAVYWNRGAEALSGLEPTELRDLHVSQLYNDDAGQPAPLGLALPFMPGKRREAEGWLTRKDGARFYAHQAVTALYDEAGKLVGYAHVTHDISWRKQFEAQLVQAQKMEGLGHMAAGIVHDFNNMLMAIMGRIDMLLVDLPGHSPQREDIEQVQQTAQRAAALTRQFLTFARNGPTTPRDIDLKQLVADMEKLLRQVLGGSITLVNDIHASLEPVYADQGGLEQVLVNLAVNARDAMPGGGVFTITAMNVVFDQEDAWQHGLAPGAYVLLAVRDTGSGIAPEVQARVFEPFFTTKEPGRGTGLGLATCYGLVKQYGGTIEVASEVGRGTIFRVYLPRSLNQPAP
jgi:PAS domain S-box-containing protein